MPPPAACAPPPPGSIEVILGPMFAGKSTDLLRRIRRHELASRRCVLVKPVGDTRSGPSTVATHDGCGAAAVECERLCDAVLPPCDVIGVDEGQFFPDLVEWCVERADAGAVVIVAALSGDSERRNIGEVSRLIPHADRVVFHTAVCEGCGADAPFTRRKEGQSDRQVLVGGKNEYRASCRACLAFDDRPF